MWIPIIGKELFLEAQDNKEHDKTHCCCKEGWLHGSLGKSVVLFHRCCRTFSSGSTLINTAAVEW